MMKVYEIWLESSIDNEEDDAYVLASYTNRKSAEEHLAWIWNKLRERIQLYGRGTIDEYVPGVHLCGEGFEEGYYNHWSINEIDVQDEFIPSDHTPY